MRSQEGLSRVPELIARPSITSTVVLKAASMFSLEDVFDHDLWTLDGIQLGAYIAEDMKLFGMETMEGGENAMYQIGLDIFKVGELEAAWPANARVRPASPIVTASTISASLLFPDRIPWFVLEPTQQKPGLRA
jgi:hypothetical protein